MDEQEVYDTIITHLRKQGSRSLLTDEQAKKLFVSYGSCAYRSVDGKKCAAGIMILDKEYSFLMEGINITGLLSRGDCPGSLRERMWPHYYLISDLQFVHDKVPVEMWEDEFRRVALMHHLTYTAPNATNS